MTKDRKRCDKCLVVRHVGAFALAPKLDGGRQPWCARCLEKALDAGDTTTGPQYRRAYRRSYMRKYMRDKRRLERVEQECRGGKG